MWNGGEDISTVQPQSLKPVWMYVLRPDLAFTNPRIWIWNSLPANSVVWMVFKLVGGNDA
jgi:hypothetical protein